jgi:GNAT superfamily N-acetyltransferase
MTAATTLADVWRLEPSGPTTEISVREAEPADFARIRQLQVYAYPALSPTDFQQLEHQVDAFPAGQMVAVAEGEIVGFASSLIVQWDRYALDHTWASITGDGYFSTHDAAGKTLYGVDLVIDPKRQRHGIGRALNKARRRLCQARNLRRIIADARLAHYARERETMTPEVYAKRVVWGDLDDALMRFHIAQGYQYCGVIRDYRPEDAEAGGNAALFVWLNPKFSPTREDAAAAADRRKVA